MPLPKKAQQDFLAAASSENDDTGQEPAPQPAQPQRNSEDNPQRTQRKRPAGDAPQRRQKPTQKPQQRAQRPAEEPAEQRPQKPAQKAQRPQQRPKKRPAEDAPQRAEENIQDDLLDEDDLDDLQVSAQSSESTQEEDFDDEEWGVKKGVRYKKIPKSTYDSSGRPELNEKMDPYDMNASAETYLAHLRIPLSDAEKKKLDAVKRKKKELQDAKYEEEQEAIRRELEKRKK